MFQPTKRSRTYVILDESEAAGTNNITIPPNGSDTINGGSSVVINMKYGCTMLYSNGADAWFVCSAG